MTDDLDVAIRHVRTVALWHPTLIRRAPIGMYYLYEDRRIRLRVSDQVGLDDYGVWVPARGDDWATVLLCPPIWRPPGSRRCSSRATGFLICARWRRAGVGSCWIGAPRTGFQAGSREAAREMAGSLQNARQYLGKEGAFLHA